MWDKDTLKDAERQREHNERMHAAGEQFARAMDERFSSESEEAMAEAIFEALSRRYGLNDGDEGEGA